MDKALYDRGLAMRRKVLGDEYVDRAIANTDDFNRDFHVSFTEEEIARGQVDYNYTKMDFPKTEAPGISVFARDTKGTVYHTYSTYGRGVDVIMGTYHLLDLVPKGRDEDGLEYSMEWMRHHDRYDSADVAIAH